METITHYKEIVKLALSEGKVYLQHDGTDLEFALRLFEKGIPKSDMVVAYRSPLQRQLLTGFALA
jgi:XisI protein